MKFNELPLQYITDKSGNRLAVVVPIEIWNNIVIRYADVKNLIEPKKRASDYKGILTKEEVKRYQEYVKQSRDEWDREIDFSPLKNEKTDD